MGAKLFSCASFISRKEIRPTKQDDEKATTTIIEDYVELVETSITKAQSITTIT